MALLFLDALRDRNYAGLIAGNVPSVVKIV
jgi:hypothetical protein